MRRECHLQRLQRPAPIPQNEDGNAGAAQQAAPPVAYSDREKNLDLFDCLGAEGQRLFYGTPNSQDYARDPDVVMTVCDGLFREEINALIATKHFRDRYQKSDETADAFLTELRLLAREANFEQTFVGLETHELRIALITHCRDKDLQQKLLAEHQTSDLDTVLNAMRADEAAKRDVQLLQKKSGGASGGGSSIGAGQSSRRRVHQKKGNSGENNNSCPGCGVKGHSYRAPPCKFKDTKCDYCDKLGHPEARCFKKKWDGEKKHNERKSQGAATAIRQANASVCEVSDTKIHCSLSLQLPVTGVPSPPKSATFMADTGADISTLHRATVKKFFKGIPLEESDIIIHNFQQECTVVPDGFLRLRTKFRENPSAEVKFYVIPDNCLVVVGLPDMKRLGMRIDITRMTVAAVNPLPESENLVPARNIPSAPAVPIQGEVNSDILLDSLIQEFPRLFQSGIGKIPDFQHKIQLKESATPKQQKLRFPPYALREEVRKELDSLIEQGVIERTDKAEYIHPLHFIRKPDGQIRTTVDFSRGLNEDIVPTVHPLPLPSEILSHVGDDRYFSKLDIAKAYFHVELAPESRPLTAFLSDSHGLCQFKRLPMGLTDSGAVFQKQVELTLAGEEGVDAYVDDILIRGKTRKEHDERLRKALAKLEERDFRLQKHKLLIAKTEVPFTGHLITSSPSGTVIKPDPKNGEAIRELNPPTDIAGIRQFNGCCNYYSPFIRDFAELSEPLRLRTRKNATFSWDEQCQTAFDVLKSRITSPEVLVPFNPNLPTFLTTDASDVGLGAVLSQTMEGMDRPIAFASKTLSSAERNYSTPERETLACVWAAEHFDKFLFGRHFTLRTDQSSLQTLLTRFSDTRSSHRISRWFDRMRHYSYDVIHIKGKNNVCADMLSRLAAESIPSDSPALSDDDDSIIIASLSVEDSVTLEEIDSESRADQLFNQIRKFLSTEWPTRKTISENLRAYFDVRDELSVKNFCIFRGEKIIVPPNLRQRILNLLHSGHPGVARMKQKLNDAYFWPHSNNSAIEHFVRHCVPCAASGKSARPESVPVTAIPPPNRPWQKVAIDITGPFHTAPKHQENIVVLTDYFSKYPEILLTSDVTSGRIISWLEDVFARYGNPLELVSDNGPQFISREFKEFLSAKNILHNPVPVYCPMQNGLVEVFNRSLKFGARIINTENMNFRSGMLSLLASFLSIAPEHGKSPSELLFGWKIRSDSDIRNSSLLKGGEVGAEEVEVPPKTPLSMEEREAAVKKKYQMRRYGQSNRSSKNPYHVGDSVRVRRPPSTVLKGQNPYSEPLKVEKRLGRWKYRLTDGRIWNARRMVRHRPPNPTDEEIEEGFLLIPEALPPLPPTIRKSGRINKGLPPQRLIADPTWGN
ncbi:MAG: DDE-type integrase/transposase/recombinase [Gammaproteobacteria bacterium]|nr:DDE-type integrase/transposase/recombinase [Gammaproteobacteria bacterium]